MNVKWVLLLMCIGSCGGKSPADGSDIVPDAVPVVDVAIDPVHYLVIDTAPPPDALDLVSSPDVPDTTDAADVDTLCIPNCEGKECGPDGCGDSCGECLKGGVCVNGVCPCGCDFTDEMVAVDNAMKLSVLDPGEGGYAGFALDVDGNPETCAPVGECQEGLDNSFSIIATSMALDYTSPPPNLVLTLEAFGAFFMLDLQYAVLDGTEFVIPFLLGTPDAAQDVCDWQTERCDYTIEPMSYNCTNCEPLLWFDDARVVDGKMLAGGKDSVLNLTFPISSSNTFSMELYMLQLQATAVVEGEMIVAFEDGVLGGVFDKQAFMDTCPALGDPVLGLPVSSDVVCDMCDLFFVADIDRDGDGIPESVSFGYAFETIPASIVGLTQE